MYRFSLLALLFFAESAFSQYSLSDKKPDGTPLFVAGWENVPAPEKPLVQYENQPGVRFHSWTINEAGDYEIRNALVDYYHRAGAWSAIKTMSLPKGWFLYVSAGNQPHDVRSVGVVWQVRKVGQANWEVFVDSNSGIQPHTFGSYIPTSQATSPLRYQINYPVNPQLREGGLCDQVAPAPDVITVAVPNVSQEMAYCWVTHAGETALSPSAIMPATTANGASPDAMTYRELRIGTITTGGQKFPHGALGFHLYAKINGEWRRQPKREAAANADDWLWQPDDCRFKVMHWKTDGPIHSPAAQAKSYLSAFQRMMMYTKGDVRASGRVEIYSPLVEEYEGREGVQTSTVTIPAKTATIAAGNASLTVNGVVIPLPMPESTVVIEPAKTVTFTDPLKQPYTGSEGVQKFGGKKGRKIIGDNLTIIARGRCPVEANAANNHATYWPAIVTEGRGQWSDVNVIAKDDANPDKRMCSAALCFRDYSGGQSMACTFDRCIFTARTDSTDYRTQAMRVQWECEGTQGHTASELTFHDCTFSGTTCIWLEHNQTANVKFTGETYAQSFVNHRQCPAIWLNLPCQVIFEKLYTDSYGSILSLGWQPEVIIGYIFIDQAHSCLIDCNNQQPGRVTINNGQINHRSPQAGLSTNLLRVPNSANVFPLHFANFKSAEGPIRAVGVMPNRIKLTADKSNILGITTIVEPTPQQWTTGGYGTAAVGTMQGISIPGQNVTIPGKSVDVVVNGQTVPVPVPEQVITIPSFIVNSLSDLPQVVAKQGWQ